MKAAIYSRKSKFTGKGESIGNQIQLCREYGHKLNIDEYEIYEDEGFSGGNTDRPEFKRLIKDAQSKKFNVLICYRLDRISRNIADFSNLINELQGLEIDFISIREQFDTSTPMGRAMMYIASVFAQLERETIAERIRDNMLELAKTGRWLGGQTPLGFESRAITFLDSELKERSMYRLFPVSKELITVKIIYEKYLEFQSINKVYKFLFTNNIKTKLGADWNKKKVQLILRNPIYVKSNDKVLNYLNGLGMNVAGIANGNGILTYNKSKGIKIKRDISEWIAAVSQHKGVIDSKDWLKVQSILDKNKVKAPRIGTSSSAILTGLLRCSNCKSNMIIKYGHISKVSGKRYRYYACSNKDNSYSTKCTNSNVRIDELENAVIHSIKIFNTDLFINYLLEELESYRLKHSTESDYCKSDSISIDISSKEKSMQSLVKALSETDNSSLKQYIMSEMENLNIEIEKLKSKLSYINKLKVKTYKNSIDLNKILDNLNDFSFIISLIEDIDCKKLFIKSLISKIYWDGKNKSVSIELYKDDKIG